MLMGGFSVTAFAQTPENDATNDTGVVVEETEDTPPLTPDGNATLVDDYGGNKQLITVTTKAATISISSSTGTTRAKHRPFPQSSRRSRPYGSYGGRGRADGRNARRLQLYG